MPEDGAAEELSYQHAASQSGSHDESPEMAAAALSRLAKEAKRAISFGGRGVRDITEDFSSASNQLEAGQLVKDEFFTLFEAVGALEVMDPKMDSGYVAPDDTFEPDFDLSYGLDAPEALWIMDQLLCLEITWYDGYPLSQTIFTSLHVDRLLLTDQDKDYTFYDKRRRPINLTPEEELMHSVLRAYCIALIKCCHLALHLIQAQNFYEEEDFVTHLFGRELLPKLGATEASSILDEALHLVAEADLSNDIHEALIVRLEFRQRYLKTLVDEGNHWSDLIDDLDTIKTSHRLATPVPDAFSEKVQRRLATSTPPRPMLHISWDVACSNWKGLFEDIVAAHRLTSSEIIRSPACLQRAVWAFSYPSRPCSLARAEIQDILFADQAVGGEIPHYELLLTDIRELVLAGDALTDPESFQVELTSDPRHICSRLIEGFMDKAIDEYLNLYRMVCQNRCRIRRTFTQAIPILDTLELEAVKMDEELKKVTSSLVDKLNPKTGKMDSFEPLTYWTKFYKLRIIAWTIQLGFETDIYLPDELWMMCYFLAQISTQRSLLIENIEFLTIDRMKTSRDKAAVIECQAAVEWLQSMNDMTRITIFLARALCTFYKLLMEVGIISSPDREFANPQLLYEARMKPYLNVVHDAIPRLEEFERARKQVDTVENMCRDINDWINKAKVVIASVKKLTPEQAKYVGTEHEWNKEIKQLETTCVAIAVGTSQLLRAHGKYGPDRLRAVIECSPEKKYHEWWVVPQLKEKAS